ncbi:MAG TPA: hypothetical protein VK348_05645, partial [Planctomycetota bacterium]|nr:hypothetical protein [Planctomycetota bacterium]
LGVPAAAVIGPDLSARLQQAGLEPMLAAEVRAAVDTGVAARYGGSGGLDAAAVRALVHRLEPTPLQRGPAGPALLLLCVLCGGGARAQAPASAAFTAYRNGDYAAAVTAFEQQAEATQDRRWWFNAGNASYRQGNLARALWAYECARLGMPRDPDLLANIALVSTRLELGDQAGEPFLTALAQLCFRFSTLELATLAGLCHLLAAGCLLLGWRRMPLRAIGLLAATGGVLLGVELLWFGPERPPRAIVQETCELVAEPRQAKDLPRLATIKPGVAVEVLGHSDAWLLVAVQDRKGYLPNRSVAEVR